MDPGLSERGLKQAELLGRALEKEKIDFLYSSPLRRTYQTAQEIAKRHGLEIIEDKRIIEIDHGVWSGMLVEEVKERFPEDFRMWLEEPHRVKFEGGESLEDVFKRVKDFVEFLREKHWGQTVAIVSHTVPIRAMLCALLNIDLSKFWAFGCDNASYSLVHMEEKRNVIVKLNITCHLGEWYVQAHHAL